MSVDPEYEMLCAMATFTLTALATYTDEGVEELDAEEATHLMPVIIAFQMMVGDEDDDDGGDDYRVDGTVY